MCWAEGLFTGGVNAAAAALTQLLSTEPFSVAESSMVIVLLFTLSLSCSPLYQLLIYVSFPVTN